jgi:hypothetical protein
MVGAIAKDIRNDPHRRGWRIDIGVAHHEFFQHVILDRAGQRLWRNTLFLCGGNEQRQNRQNRPVHRHGNRHPVQRNVTEQKIHVGDRINRHARHANIIGHQIIIRIITAMRWQIESDRQPHLPGRQIAAVKGI